MRAVVSAEMMAWGVVFTPRRAAISLSFCPRVRRFCLSARDRASPVWLVSVGERRWRPVGVWSASSEG